MSERARDFIRLLREADIEPRAYSGRGMFGRQCVAARFDGSTIQLAVALFDQQRYVDYLSFDELRQILGRTREDSLGLGFIYYWPSEEWNGEDYADDDAEREGFDPQDVESAPGATAPGNSNKK